MESNKLTVEEFARKNIGKSFKTEAMIVGYSSFKQLLICSVTECCGCFYIAHTELIAKNLL